MKQEQNTQQIRVPMPREEQMFAVVNRVLGGSRMSVHCEDGKSRLARIPGGKRRGMGRIRAGDLVLISPWDVQDEKADVQFRYRKNQARFLDRKNSLPDEINF